jgi:hypothetical protein
MYGGFAVERIVAGRAGLGFDVGGTNGKNSAYGAAMLTFGASYRLLRDRVRKADPFISVGVTALSVEHSPALLAFGGGLNYWVSERFGVRAEVRDHAGRNDGVRRRTANQFLTRSR